METTNKEVQNHSLMGFLKQGQGNTQHNRPKLKCEPKVILYPDTEEYYDAECFNRQVIDRLYGLYNYDMTDKALESELEWMLSPWKEGCCIGVLKRRDIGYEFRLTENTISGTIIKVLLKVAFISENCDDSQLNEYIRELQYKAITGNE